VEDLGQASCLVVVLGVRDGEILGILLYVCNIISTIVAYMAPQRGRKAIGFRKPVFNSDRY
jgi:hypothetical protein